ncbi:hypothetical protein HMI54_010030 [Coelomomyces lativittatus]|nr:hypothetical protein HMI55_001508 [Coelomomyces lativittatus]KAJ1515134.1 hypothetical protein HMI56_006511 [Coelomomyces lativittatus]KAJ1516292.1 hypothetical protein HMI54_010030 [Coelomomyces lativittatus]
MKSQILSLLPMVKVNFFFSHLTNRPFTFLFQFFDTASIYTRYTSPFNPRKFSTSCTSSIPSTLFIPTTTSLPYRCILINSNPCNPKQLFLSLPDPSNPSTTSYVQLFNPSIQPSSLFREIQETFPNFKFRYTIGFSNEPYTFPTSLVDCLKSNLVVWIQNTPYLVMTQNTDFISPKLQLTKLQQYEVIDQLVNMKLKLYMYAGVSWLVSQLSTMIYLTYELGWDVMEPVSYLVGLGTTILGATYYAFFRTEYTYEDVFPRLEAKLKQSLTSQCKIDS